MLILLSLGVVTTVTVLYVGRKGWLALHKAVGITPGILTYQSPQAPLSAYEFLSNMKWQQLNLDNKHLKCLSDSQLRQLQNIDKKVVIYQNYQQNMQQQNITPVVTEQHFVLHKWLHQRLPEMLASYYHLVNASTNRVKSSEAEELLQILLDNIEQRLNILLEQMEGQHLQDLRVMKQYMDSHS